MNGGWGVEVSKTLFYDAPGKGLPCLHERASDFTLAVSYPASGY